MLRYAVLMPRVLDDIVFDYDADADADMPMRADMPRYYAAFARRK